MSRAAAESRAAADGAAATGGACGGAGAATAGGASGSPLRGYEALLEHAELELELAGRGELSQLAALGARWEELVAALPERPPAAAADLLERARLMHERTRVELSRLREALLSELASTSQARRAADGYAGQLRRRPRLDRSA